MMNHHHWNSSDENGTLNACEASYVIYYGFSASYHRDLLQKHLTLMLLCDLNYQCVCQHI